MWIVVALGGNALLSRGQALTAANRRRNVRLAAEALAPLAEEHDLVISHGNGPQVGLLALQSTAYRPEAAQPLDILDAETEGQIGYLIEQELANALPSNRRCAALLTQIEVDRNDPAFLNPTKPIGPLYERQEAERLASERGWTIAPDGEHLRRVVPSPRPRRIIELQVIDLLVQHKVVVICAGGGGIPVVAQEDGTIIGVEAVIDKDHASAALALGLKAQALLMLTDVDAVYNDWDAPQARAIRRASPGGIRQFHFAAGTMGPKVEAACTFAATGGLAGIGRLQDAAAILSGKAGTVITGEVRDITWWDYSALARAGNLQ
jgi:carbamate kinase